MDNCFPHCRIFIIFSGNIFIHYVKNAEDLCQSSDDGFDEGMDTSDNENQDASKSQPLAQYRNAIYKIGMCIVMLYQVILAPAFRINNRFFRSVGLTNDLKV